MEEPHVCVAEWLDPGGLRKSSEGILRVFVGCGLVVWYGMDFTCRCDIWLRHSAPDGDRPPRSCTRLLMNRATENMSCAANARPKATEAPTINPDALEPNIVVDGSWEEALVRQIRLATDTAAPTTHKNNPPPNQMPVKLPKRGLRGTVQK